MRVQQMLETYNYGSPVQFCKREVDPALCGVLLTSITAWAQKNDDKLRVCSLWSDGDGDSPGPGALECRRVLRDDLAAGELEGVLAWAVEFPQAGTAKGSWIADLTPREVLSIKANIREFLFTTYYWHHGDDHPDTNPHADGDRSKVPAASSSDDVLCTWVESVRLGDDYHVSAMAGEKGLRVKSRSIPALTVHSLLLAVWHVTPVFCRPLSPPLHRRS
jgi:hypothetical protein